MASLGTLGTLGAQGAIRDAITTAALTLVVLNNAVSIVLVITHLY